MTKQEPFAELTSRAIKVLYREIGPAWAIRFINQFSTGYGDYTAEREATLGASTLDQIIAEIKQTADLR